MEFSGSFYFRFIRTVLFKRNIMQVMFRIFKFLEATLKTS